MVNDMKSKQTKVSNPAVENTTNPYINGRREWNERYGSYIQRANTWRMAAFICMGIALIAVIGMAYIGAQNKLVPYMVEVDKLGQAVAVRRADVASAPDSRIVKAQIASFIESCRSVYTDFAAQKSLIDTCYSMVKRGSPAYNKLNNFYAGNTPFKRAESETVGIELHSVIPMSDKTWRSEWKETKYDRAGVIISQFEMSAITTVSINPPLDEANILVNPMGVFVDDFNWSSKL